MEGKMCKNSRAYQEVQSSSYKINNSWGCNEEHGDYSQ